MSKLQHTYSAVLLLLLSQSEKPYAHTHALSDAWLAALIKVVVVSEHGESFRLCFLLMILWIKLLACSAFVLLMVGKLVYHLSSKNVV